MGPRALVPAKQSAWVAKPVGAGILTVVIGDMWCDALAGARVCLSYGAAHCVLWGALESGEQSLVLPDGRIQANSGLLFDCRTSHRVTR